MQFLSNLWKVQNVNSIVLAKKLKILQLKGTKLSLYKSKF